MVLGWFSISELIELYCLTSE